MGETPALKQYRGKSARSGSAAEGKPAATRRNGAGNNGKKGGASWADLSSLQSIQVSIPNPFNTLTPQVQKKVFW